jgi:hypothetical protein
MFPFDAPSPRRTLKEQGLILAAKLHETHITYAERIGIVQKLLALKRQTKLGWESLGVDPTTVHMIKLIMANMPKPVRGSAKTRNLSKLLHSSSEVNAM